MTGKIDKLHLNILGGGVIGITQALYYQLHGVRTTLYTQERPDGNAPGSRPPGVSSYHPAASVIPHSVSSPLVTQLTGNSQRIFSGLVEDQLSGVRRQRHFEVFENRPERIPDYAKVIGDFEELPETGEGTPQAPRRAGASAIYGWGFNICFAEMRTYLPWLYKLYEAAGGEIKIEKLVRDDFVKLGDEILINCAGLQGNMFGDDPAEPRIVRGHLVAINIPEIPADPISWNYHPTPDIYRDARGNPADVYSYPRSIKGGGWIVGGSRQFGQELDGRWIGEETAVSTIKIKGIEVPEPIWTLNRELILQISHIDIDYFLNRRQAFIGYRPVRTGDASLRLEQSPQYSNLFHNYGHGGSGVTTSWGCAIEIGQLIQRKLGVGFNEPEPFRDSNPSANSLNLLQRLIRQCVA